MSQSLPESAVSRLIDRRTFPRQSEHPVGEDQQILASPCLRRVPAGEGSKGRIVYATDGAGESLDAWLVTRGAKSGPLFWPADGRGRPLDNRRMTDQAIMLILRKRAEQTQVPAFTPHDLRRSFISDLLEAGADVVTMQARRARGRADDGPE